MSLVVITGAPGAGKTALLQALRVRGYEVVADTPRAIIQERRRRGLSPRPEPLAFTKETLRIDIENYQRYSGHSGHVFFERGVLDALAGLDAKLPLSESDFGMWLSKYPYFSKVFVLPPWRAIYVTDAERDHTFEHAQWVDRVTREWYRRCGYQIVEVPMASVDERCEFVLRECARGAE